MKSLVYLVLTLPLMVGGCAHNISDASRVRADSSITFASLKENPDAYRGHVVVLGGTIADTAPVPGGMRLEIVAYRLDPRETPDVVYEPEGRFIATVPDSLKAVPCRVGQEVTLAGEGAGKEVRGRAGKEDIYPMVTVTELRRIRALGESAGAFRVWVPYGGGN